MMIVHRQPRLALAWVALTLALALHVADEAFHDFLDFYNPLMMSLRDMLLWTWLPTFEFGPWLGGLIAAVAALLGLSWFAFRRARWIRWAALIYGLVMLLNGLLHLAGSAYLQKQVPGVLSAPLIAGCGAWLLVEAVRERRSEGAGSRP